MAISSDAKPTVLFVPGAWHTSDGFAAPRQHLEELGYPTEAVNHPSIGDDRSKSTVDDAAGVAKVLAKLADEGKEIVVVCHSYGGVVASNAVEGFGAIKRAKEGKKGGIISLIYMAAFVLQKGNTLLGGLGGIPLPWMDMQGEVTYASDAPKIFYNDLPAAEQQSWESKLLPITSSVFSSPVTYEPWRDMPCAYIICTIDNAIPVGLQKGMLEFLKGASPYQVASVEFEASHSPFLSVPDKISEAVNTMAKVGSEQSALNI